jgi:hypothetical protein
MDKTKLIILVLVLVAIIAFMALAGGAWRDSQEGTGPPRNYRDTAPGTRALEKVTGVFRSEFDLDRLRGCNRSGNTINLSDACEIVVAPGGLIPGRFRLSPSGGQVYVCFAMSRPGLADCLASRDDQRPEHLEQPANFTVANDSAYLHLDCRSPTDCTVMVSSAR